MDDIITGCAQIRSKMATVKIYFNDEDNLASTFPREGSRLATEDDLVSCYFIDENGEIHDNCATPFLSALKADYIELSDGVHQIDWKVVEFAKIKQAKFYMGDL